MIDGRRLEETDPFRGVRKSSGATDTELLRELLREPCRLPPWDDADDVRKGLIESPLSRIEVFEPFLLVVVTTVVDILLSCACLCSKWGRSRGKSVLAMRLIASSTNVNLF